MHASLASGLSTSPVEIIIFFSILAVAGGLWIGTSLHRARMERFSRDSQAAAYYQQLLQTRGLSATERDLVERLTAYAGTRRERYMLLLDQRVFNHAVAALLEEEGEENLSRGDLTSLRVSLGFSGAATGMAPRSTAELPPGAQVHVGRPNREPASATVVMQERSLLRLKTDPESPRFHGGHAVKLVHRNAGGICTFRCTVFRHDGENLEVSHSEEARRTQRREHYRRQCSLPVSVSSSEESETVYQSQFTELGGNGATIVNPDSHFHAGQELELAFRPDPDSAVTIFASVIRTSREGTLLHVRFIKVPDSVRDRVYRFLFNC